MLAHHSGARRGRGDHRPVRRRQIHAARCLNLLETPTSGHIYFGGVDITDKKVDINLHRRKMGMVFQHFNLFPHKTVMQNITLAPSSRSSSKTEDEAKKHGMELSSVSALPDKANEVPEHALRRAEAAALRSSARCAWSRTDALLTSRRARFDPEMVGEVLDLMRQLAADGMTMAVVTHEMASPARWRAASFFMDGGAILRKTRPPELFDHPQNPRTQTFLSKVL